MTSIVFRTDLYGVLADGTDGEVVAFEVDELDDRMRSGWSVLVTGRISSPVSRSTYTVPGSIAASASRPEAGARSL